MNLGTAEFALEFAQESFAYINGAAEHWSSLHGFLQDDEEVAGAILRLIHLTHATREVLHGLHGASSFQGFIAAVQPERRTMIDLHKHKQVWHLNEIWQDIQVYLVL